MASLASALPLSHAVLAKNVIYGVSKPTGRISTHAVPAASALTPVNLTPRPRPVVPSCYSGELTSSSSSRASFRNAGRRPAEPRIIACRSKIDSGREPADSSEGTNTPAVPQTPSAGSSSRDQAFPPAPTAAPAQPQPYGVPERGEEPDVWDVVGLGQAMVDFSAMISDEFLDSLSLPRGQRVVVDHEERGQVLQALDGCAYKLSAGGSLSNTLVALARLGKVQGAGLSGSAGEQEGEAEGGSSDVEKVLPDIAQGVARAATQQGKGRSQVNVAMVGSVGSDALGDFYQTKLLRANVHFLSPPLQGGTTGTVIVLTTPDAQRTMLSYQGMSSEVAFDAAMKAVVAKSRVLVVEGYLWELPQTVDAIEEACAVARSKGLLVALTASDASCVLRHRPKFWNVMCRSAHILFANASEARALAGCSESTSTAALAQHLSQFCPLVSVTDGEAGSYLGLRGQVIHIPAENCVPKDTCGAGDAYAAGALYALLKGAPDLASIGSIAAKVSSVVVCQQGARLGEEDAGALSDMLGFTEKSLGEGHVFHRMMGLQPVPDMVNASS